MQLVSADTDSWNVTEPEIMETDRYLSGTNAPEIQEDIRLCIVSGARDMILDCSHLTYMTGAGMHMFLSVAHMMQEVGGKFSVRGLKGQPRQMFYACGMDKLIPDAGESEIVPAEWAA